MESIKILFVSADFYPSNTGFANATLNLIMALKKYKPEIGIHVYTETELLSQEELKGISISRYKSYNKNSKPLFINEILRKFKYLNNYVLSNKIDLIFFETNTFSIVQNLILYKYKNRCLVRIHSTADAEYLLYYNRKSLLSKLLRHFDLLFLRKINNILATNSYHLKFIRERIFKGNVYDIWDNKDYFVLPNTVLLDDAAIESYNQSDQRVKYILTMGKLSDNGFIQKGIMDVFKAIYHLKSVNKLPDRFQLKVVGDGIRYDEIYKYAEKLEIIENINFIRYLDHKDTIKMIKNSLGIILLSRYEGQSMFITESIAIGKALIITTDNGMNDLIVSNFNGYEIKVGDYLEAAKSIVNLYSLDESQIQMMENNSKDLFRKNFSAKVIADSFTNIVSLIYKKNNIEKKYGI